MPPDVGGDGRRQLPMPDGRSTRIGCLRKRNRLAEAMTPVPRGISVAWA
jgi:hypothetical protein